MTTWNLLYVSLVALVLSFGCGLDVEDTDSGRNHMVPTVTVEELRPARADGSESDMPASSTYIEVAEVHPSGDLSGLCSCATLECVQDTVLAEYGCGFCVDAVCEGKLVGGCYDCADPTLSHESLGPRASASPQQD